MKPEKHRSRKRCPIQCQRNDRWRFRRSMRVDVVATTEAEVLAALAQPKPFYAELR